MILEKLKLCAFGPFKKEYEINFNELNKSGIFLLTGETGVGKTSIFDAIVYALYGNIAGANQDLQRIRSNYADETILTYVELTLFINNKKYFIRREPQQEVIGKGNRVVKHSPTCVLKYDNECIEGIKEVNKKIISIIGLDLNQFRQIVMIPQGEFMRLLVSSSEEKVKIFRQIFKTNELEKFEDFMFSKSKELSEGIKDVSKRINFYFQDLIDNDESINTDIRINMVEEKIKQFNDEYKMINITHLETSNTLKNIRESYNEKDKRNNDIKKFKELKNEFLELKKSKDKVDDLRKSLDSAKVSLEIKKIDESIIEYNNQINKLKDEIENINKKNSIIREELIKSEQKKMELIALNQTNENNKLMLHTYKEKQKYKNEYNSLNEKLDELSYGLSKKNKRCQELETLIKKYKEDLIDLYSKIDSFRQDIEQESILIDEKHKISNLINKLNDYKNYQKSIDEIKELAEKQALDAQEDYKKSVEIESKIVEYKKMIAEDKAAFMALNLVEGQPCPVCGSKHHPMKAITAEFEVTDEMIDNLNKEKDFYHSRAIEKRARIQEQISKISYFEHQQQSLNISYSDDLLIEKINELRINENKLLNISNLKIELNNLNNLYNQKNDLYNEDMNELNEIKLDIQNSNKEIELIAQKINMLNIDESEDIDSIVYDLENSITNYENDKAYYIDLVSKLNTDISLNEQNIYNIKSNINRITNDLVIKKQEKQRRFQDDNSYEKYLLDENLMDSYELRIKEYDEKMNYYLEYFKRNYKLENEEETDLKPLLNMIDDVNKKFEIELEALTTKKNLIDKYMNTLSKIKIEVGNSKKKIEIQEKIQKLSNLTNGNNRLKMSFEKYVLAIYFEDIINFANTILKKLTDRYILVRKDDLGLGNAQQGLDIDVYDFDTCKKRSVKTLSGGETFKASLALALGLSEMIKRRRSFVEINTMFIDEGFGTLDEESLDSAISMLMGFKEEGLKIGIISHVSELKTRFNSRISISRTNEGSSIKVIG